MPLPPAPTQSPLGAVTLSTLETPPFAVPLVRTQLCLICLSQKKEEVELWLTRAGGEQSLFACGDWGGEYETHSSLLLRKLSTWLRSCMSHCLCSLHLIFFLCCPPPPSIRACTFGSSLSPLANLNSRCLKTHPLLHSPIVCPVFCLRFCVGLCFDLLLCTFYLAPL